MKIILVVILCTELYIKVSIDVFFKMNFEGITRTCLELIFKTKKKQDQKMPSFCQPKKTIVQKLFLKLHPKTEQKKITKPLPEMCEPFQSPAFAIIT